jgi:hypothetical protein
VAPRDTIIVEPDRRTSRPPDDDLVLLEGKHQRFHRQSRSGKDDSALWVTAPYSPVP